MAPILFAPLFAIVVPFMKVKAAIEMAPSASQYILQRRAPLINITLELAPVVNAPPNLKINMEFGSPPPSKVSVPANDPAAAMAYTPGGRVSPLPNVGV